MQIRSTEGNVNVTANAREFKPTIGQGSCPKCGEQSFPNGIFLSVGLLDLALPKRVLFFTINFGVALQISWCPKCGHLNVDLRMK
jgi:ribosomal protein S27AE